MSDTWVSTVYFPMFQSPSFDVLSSIMHQLEQTGLTLQRSVETGKGQWFDPQGEIFQIASIEEVIRLTIEHGGGSLNVGEQETGMADTLAIYPWGGGWLGPKSSAEFEYGNISIMFDYGNLRNESHDTLRRRYELIFRWSNLLVRTTNAIYGWGDLQSNLWNTGLAVQATDLQQWNIPRFSWWNFFSKAYLQHVGKNRLSTTAAWLEHEDEYGLTVILRSPGEPSYASREELLGLIA
ncbi:MAG: hypothetical protein R3E79_09265 [Caldilineaceae bacterium]